MPRTRPTTTLWVLIASALFITATIHAIANANALGIPDSEYNALVALYSATGGSNWNNKSNWLTDSTPWRGVDVQNGHVTAIGLDDNNLTGHLPPELGDLTQLRLLHLDFNDIGGSLPAALGGLTSLEDVCVSYNSLTGQIPAELGSLTNLRMLHLLYNRLSGSIPLELGNLTNLKDLMLNGNQLTGPIPAELGRLANLQNLILEDNQLSGQIPPELAGLNNLENLALSSNQLSGSIPPELGNMSHLWSLSLSNNQLTGTIPPELGKLTSLGIFGAANNMLVGAIPYELGDMTGLIGIGLDNNQLSGAIPATLGHLAYLRELHLSHNQLSGPILSQLANATRLTNIDLSYNSLDGPIPDEFGHLTNLEQLDLSHNGFTGTIPPQLGSLPNLYNLYLTDNQLSGEIPAELANLPNLCGLLLSRNQLTGPIPPELGSMPVLGSLQLNGNHLTGTIPSELANLGYLQTLDLSRNQLTGPLPDEFAHPRSLYRLNLSGNNIVGEIPSWIVLWSWVNFDLNYNGLWSSDPQVNAFLTGSGWDFRPTQTVPPANTKVEWTGIGSARISWTPIEFSSTGGYYEIGYGPNDHGPFAFDPAYRTLNKQASSVAISGLDINTALYFVIRTISMPNEFNQSTLTSSLSTPLVLSPPGRSKYAYDTRAFMLDGSDNMVVTANFSDCFYVEKKDRSWGIMVWSDDPQPAVGSRASLFGKIYTSTEGERYIDADIIESANGEALQPVGMTNLTLGGGYVYHPDGYICPYVQQPVSGGHGANNIGVLVKTSGRFTYIDDHTFWIDDGSAARIMCKYESGTVPQSGWQNVVVTGISSIRKSGDTYERLLRACSVTPK